MSDFNTPQERGRRRETEQKDYRNAFADAQREIVQLKQQITSYEAAQRATLEELQNLKQTISEDKQIVMETLNKRMGELEEDNRRLHALIQSSSDNDMKLVEQMNNNHRERMDQILLLANQRSDKNG